MSSPDSSNPNDARLWRQFAESRPPGGGDCPGDVDLAAYLDGRLADEPRDLIETHLAACPTCLDTVRELRALLTAGDESLIAPPQSVIDAAQALVAAPDRAVVETTGRGLRLADWLPVARWSLTAAASIAICFVGYQIGSSAFAVRNGDEDQLIAEISFGVFDPQTDRETNAELIAFGFGEAVR